MTLTTITDALVPAGQTVVAGVGSRTLNRTVTLPDGTSVLWVLVGWSPSVAGADSQLVSYNGRALTKASSDTSGTGGTDRSMALWFLNNPDTVGAFPLVSTMNADVTHTILLGAKFGAHMTTPFGTAVTAHGISGSSCSHATGNAYPFFSFVGTRTADVAGNQAGAAQTRRVNLLAGTNQWWSMSEQISGATATWAWQGGPDRFCSLGAQLVPATIPTGGPTLSVKRSGVFSAVPTLIWRNGGWGLLSAINVIRSITPTPPGSTPLLPFNAPAGDTANPVVFGHYFTQFPLQPASNSSDYWLNWLPPGKVEGASASFTGTTSGTTAVNGTNKVVVTDATLAGNLAVGDHVTFASGVTGTYQVASKVGTSITMTTVFTGTAPGSGVALAAARGGGDHRVYGGFTRDRALAGSGSSVAIGWQVADMEKEIQWAVDAGLDGFWIDMLSLTTSSGHWRNLNYMFDAADNYFTRTGKRFWLAPMPDGTASSAGNVATGTVVASNASADALADAIYTFVGRGCFWKVGTHYQIPIFGPEKPRSGYSMDDTRLNFWTRMRTRLAAKGTPMLVDYIMCYVDDWRIAPQAPTLDSIARSHGRWGDRDPVTSSSSSTTNRGAPAYCHTTFSKPWTHWAAPGDTRPPTAGQSVTVGTYRSWEGEGFLNLHETWKAAIDGGADYVQNTTFNDYGENAHMCPSRNNSYAIADLNAYYSAWFRTGSAPAIVRDCTYLAHRVHPWGLGSNSMPATKQVKWASLNGGTAWKNITDVTVFAVSACTVEFLVDGVVTGAPVSAVTGRNRFEFVTPASGVVSARIKRAGVVVAKTTVTSNITLGGTQTVDDYHYRSFSSLRQAAGY